MNDDIIRKAENEIATHDPTWHPSKDEARNIPSLYEYNFTLKHFLQRIVQLGVAPTIESIHERFKPYLNNNDISVQSLRASISAFMLGEGIALDPMRYLNDLDDEYKQKLKAIKAEDEKIEKIQEARDAIMENVIESFSDEVNTAWIHYRDGSTKVFCEVESQTFVDFIRVTLNELGQQPREAWIKPIVELFASMARRNGKKKLALRQTIDDEGAWIIQIDQHQSVRILNGNYEIIETPTMFRNFPHQNPFEIDLNAQEEDINRLNKYARFKTSDDLELFKDTIVTMKVPTISKPILLFLGEAGSNKSTLCSLAQRTLDPTTETDKGQAWPKDERDWNATSRQHDVVFLDNLHHITPEQQDFACRFVTGTSVKNRTLHTNLGTTAASLKGILVLNSIELIGLQSDFLDRTLISQMERVPDDERKGDEQLWREFEKDAPLIRGAIIKLLAKAQENANNVQVPKEYRLTDFARYGAAISLARGKPEGDFSRRLLLKVMLQQNETLQQSLIVEPIIRFMESREEWEGTASELYNELTFQEFGQTQIKNTSLGETNERRLGSIPRWWIRSPNALGAQLTHVMRLLKICGIAITRLERERKRRLLHIEKKGEIVVTLSQDSQKSQKTLN